MTIMAPSSTMQFAPMTIGPAIAKMVAFGCTIVPVSPENASVARKMRQSRPNKAEAKAWARTRTDGDIALELNILADDGARVYCKLVASVHEDERLEDRGS